MTMTPEMKEFLLELASLMEKHGVTEMEATEGHTPYMGSWAEGVEFTMVRPDEDGFSVYEYYVLGRYSDPESIKKASNEED